MRRILVDDILQVFDSDGNKHIILGVVSGEASPTGVDLRVPAVTLVVPHARLGHIGELLAKIANYQPPTADEEKPASVKDLETLGSPLAKLPN